MTDEDELNFHLYKTIYKSIRNFVVRDSRQSKDSYLEMTEMKKNPISTSKQISK